MLTDFENYFTVGNYLQNKQYYTSHHLLKTSLHYHVKHKNFNVAFALPILNDNAMPNFYHKFVNC